MIEESGRSEVGKGGDRARGLVDGLMWLWGEGVGSIGGEREKSEGCFLGFWLEEQSGWWYQFLRWQRWREERVLRDWEARVMLSEKSPWGALYVGLELKEDVRAGE